ncbi:MAG: histidine kinase, partial [Spirochaetae bacterium HGW-Spirochaetae-7]
MLAVAFSLVPALGIIVWTGLEHSIFIAQLDRDDAMRQVENFAEIQFRITESTRQLLSTLAALPEFRTVDHERAGIILKAILAGNTGYLNFTMVDTHGIVVASSRLAAGTDLGSRYHVIAALENRRFTVGEYITNMVDEAPSIAYCQPVFDESDRLSGALTATIVLDSYGRLFEQLKLPDEAILGLVDRSGTRLFFHPPKPTNPVGGPIKGSVWDAMSAGG